MSHAVRFARSTVRTPSACYKTEVEAMLENLRQEVRLQNVVFHKALRKYQK